MTYVAALCDSLGESSSKKAKETAAAERAVRQPGKRSVKDVVVAASAKKSKDGVERCVCLLLLIHNKLVYMLYLIG